MSIISRISEALLFEIRRSVETENLHEFVSKITPIMLNYKSINQLKFILRSLNKKLTSIWAEELFKQNDNHIVVAGILFELAEIWKSNETYFGTLMLKISVSEHWRIREIAISLLTQAITSDFEKFQPLFSEYSQSSDRNQRRVAITAAKRISSLPKKHQSVKIDILNLVESFLYEDNPYVKSVVNDTFSNGFYKNCTDMTEKWVWDVIPKVDDSNAKASILTIFSSNVTQDSMEDALRIIEHFLPDDDREVRNARTNVLRHLSTVNPKGLTKWLETRLDNSNIVEHWAELKTEGLIT